MELQPSVHISVGKNSRAFLNIWESEMKGKFGKVDGMRTYFAEIYRSTLRNALLQIILLPIAFNILGHRHPMEIPHWGCTRISSQVGYMHSTLYQGGTISFADSLEMQSTARAIYGMPSAMLQILRLANPDAK